MKDTDLQQIVTSAGVVDAKLAQLYAEVAAGRLTPTVYRNLETNQKVNVKTPLSWWQAGNTGNSGGASAKPHGTYQWYQAVPELVTVNPMAAFDNFLYVMTFPLPAHLPDYLVLGFDNFSVLPDHLGRLQALECQLELRDGLNVYNFAWQLDVGGSKQVRAFKYEPDAKGDWFAVPGVSLPDVSQPLSLKAEFRLDRQLMTATHDCLWLNGVRHQVSVTQAATPASGPIELSVAFQVDPNGPQSVTLELSNVSVAWL